MVTCFSNGVPDAHPTLLNCSIAKLGECYLLRVTQPINLNVV